MDTSRKIGIAVFSGVPAVIGGGIVYAIFGGGMVPVLVYEILLVMGVLSFVSR